MLTLEYGYFLLIVSLVVALIEIAIEGEHSGAEKNPIWKPDPDSWLAKLYSKAVMSGKSLTGYHIIVFGLVLIILHLPFSLIEWSGIKELEVVSCYLLVAMVWDFLWYVWNKYYGIRTFGPDNPKIQWHKRWIGRVPVDYPKGLAASLFLVLIAVFFAGTEVFLGWLMILGMLMGLVLFSCLIRLFLLDKLVWKEV